MDLHRMLFYLGDVLKLNSQSCFLWFLGFHWYEELACCFEPPLLQRASLMGFSTEAGRETILLHHEDDTNTNVVPEY